MSNPPSYPPSPVFVLRQRRTNIACANCRRLKKKCVIFEDPPQQPCERCMKRGLDCKYITIGEQDGDADMNYSPPTPNRPSTPAASSSSSSRNQPGSSRHGSQASAMHGYSRANQSTDQNWLSPYAHQAAQQPPQHSHSAYQMQGPSAPYAGYGYPITSSNQHQATFQQPNPPQERSKLHLPTWNHYDWCTVDPCYCGGITR
ncbi:hypothetical protein R3P38DRAFT_2888567 [Favolaschia claudopus]|uniref:Zn(2)-C6 fungal-type domain-containing protein n=1 Tax=Favolaschia claudopus TaxID=2862362 RepID=A0AAW0CU54_9AGAR